MIELVIEKDKKSYWNLETKTGAIACNSFYKTYLLIDENYIVRPA